MLLLLLGILFLHVAVLVLLFVSTIVSVSAGGQGRLFEGRQLFLLWDPRGASPSAKLEYLQTGEHLKGPGTFGFALSGFPLLFSPLRKSGQS